MAPVGHVRLRCPPRPCRATGRGPAGGQEMPRRGCHLGKPDDVLIPRIAAFPGLGLRDPSPIALTCSPGAAPGSPGTLPGPLSPFNSTTMSKLGKFFKGGGSSKSRAAPSSQEALARLRETEEMLSKKQEYLENRIQRELSLARKHGTKNKRGRLGGLAPGVNSPSPTSSRFLGDSPVWPTAPVPQAARCAPMAFLETGNDPPGARS